MLGIIWQQLAFVGHDAGHNALTGVRSTDGALGLGLGNAATGIGIGWWKATHNVHHNCVNSCDHDPDIQHMPFLALSPVFFGSLFSRFHMDTLHFTAAARRFVRVQHLAFFPLLCVARYGLVLQGIKIIGWEWHKRHTGFGTPGGAGPRCAEALAYCAYFAYMAALLAALPSWAERGAFVALSHAAFAIMHLQINLSHWSRATYLGLPPHGWVRTQLAGTLNWSCPPWLDWFHGGLQYQIEHHLFPRMPRPRLRAAAPHVLAFCAKHHLPYHQVGFMQATAEILRTLRTTALAAAASASVSKAPPPPLSNAKQA